MDDEQFQCMNINVVDTSDEKVNEEDYSNDENPLQTLTPNSYKNKA